MPELPGYAISTSWSERDAECVATCVELPGLSGLGPTPARAAAELRIAIAAWLDYLAAAGVPPPAPAAASPARGA
ncbi:MAG TPA: type II toxin-antitoxin system HicB family antitoxin [Candidatus Binatia bacterium]|nr:type II toxin-antitoxin system HicB family antitoxin [Candidatus Binatia bacterium]